MDKELTPKQQTSEAIRQAETILLMTGQRPNIDQVASTMALAAILRKYGKKVTAVISDDIPASARFLTESNQIERTLGGLRDFIMKVDLSSAEVDKLKYTIENGKLNVHVTPFAGGFQPKDVTFAYGDYQFDLVIILGVASYNRVDKVYAQNAELLRRIPLVNIDYHRINEQYGAINLVETTAASMAEILIALSESLQAGLIDEAIATTMLTGLIASTDRFTANHTTAKTMTVAAQMLAMGADQQKVVKGLYKNEKDRKPSQPGQQNQSQPKPAEKPETQAIQMERDRQEVPESQRPQRYVPAEQALRAMKYDEPDLPAAPVAQALPQTEPVLDAEPTQPVIKPEPQVEAPAQPEPSLPEEPVTPSQPSAPVIMPEPAVDAPTPEPSVPAEAQRAEEDGGSSDNDTPQGTAVGASPMEELLPPQHIELSEPEPLINDTSDQGPQQPPKHPNPTNNPIFAQRLDEFEY